MSPRIVRTVFAVLALGLAVHAVHALIGPGDGPIDHAIASWVYTGLMWVGSAMCLLAAAVRRRERGAWALIGLGLLLLVGRRPRVDAVARQPREPALPERRRRPVPRQLRRDLRRPAAAAARAPAPDPPRAVARRRGGRPGRGRGRRRARLPRAGRDHRGRHDRRRLQPRLSGLRRPAAHAHRHGLRPQPLARGPLVAAARPRAAGQRRRRLGLQLPVGGRHLRRGLLGRHAVAPGRRADRGRRVAARLAPDGRGGRRPHAAADRRASPPSRSPCSSSASSRPSTSPPRCWPPPRCSSPAPAAACSSARTSTCCARAATSRSPTASPAWPTAAP